MKKLLYFPLLLSLTFSGTACQQDHRDAQEQFRERQEAILERDAEQEEELDTAAYEVEESTAEPTAPDKPTTTASDKVVGVKDGDTVVLLKNGEEVTVRLFGVDTPEKNQAFGQRAKQFTSDLAFGKQVRLITHNKDRYGRTVGTIILPDGRNLNEELIRNGYAWHYKAYSKDVNLANAEADARRFKRGLWADANPTAPWDFRKNRSSNTSTSASTTSASSPVPAGATKRTVYLCNSSGSAVYHLDKSCSVLKRCKAEVLTVTEAVAIREYDRRADKTCSK
ncbi:thermonuclease family protein [Pontibacter cellulosilyticus]|uniref:Thermonuclease family protein n=1 Tax=Pontibacter cellulosilyticus TaxID=1720253 RepID=A0A923N5M3_9BACT|nr:thermonuclease family protein [Pontibacter cellulosilyticus]MBC5992661.1 thermonuclease family protein [Pontibacter cellulosilyticus]